MRITTRIAALIAGIAVAAIAAVAGPGPAIAADACTKLTVTGHPDYAPIGWARGKRITGAGASLVRRLAKQAGVKASFVNFGSWAAAQEAIRDGRADVIFGIYFNDERAKAMDYVQPPFMTDPVAIVARKGAGFAFTGRDSLIGRHGVTNEGESYGTDFDAFMVAKLDVERAPGVKATIATLLDGKADYMIIGRYPGMAEAVREGNRGRLEIVTGDLLSAPMFVAFSRRSPCLGLMKAFGEGIEAAKNDGSIQRMIRQADTRWARTMAPKPAAKTP